MTFVLLFLEKYFLNFMFQLLLLSHYLYIIIYWWLIFNGSAAFQHHIKCLLKRLQINFQINISLLCCFLFLQFLLHEIWLDKFYHWMRVSRKTKKKNKQKLLQRNTFILNITYSDFSLKHIVICNCISEYKKKYRKLWMRNNECFLCGHEL